MKSEPSVRQIAARGVLLALAVAGTISLIVFAVAELMGATLGDGVKAALVLGLGYLVLNLIVLGVGMLFKPSRGWSLGAALTTPVILGAIGFGYSIFLAYPL